MKSQAEYIERYNDVTVLSRDLKLGKEVAFDFLFRTRYRSLVSYALTIVKDKTQAEDIVQDIFSAIWQKHVRIKHGNSIDSYLHTSVYHECINQLRYRRKREEMAEKLLAMQDMDAWHSTDTSQVSYGWLHKTIDSLPKQCRDIFNKVVFDEMKYKEAASALNISQNTVKTQIKIAYKKIRESAAVYASPEFRDFS